MVRYVSVAHQVSATQDEITAGVLSGYPVGMQVVVTDADGAPTGAVMQVQDGGVQEVVTSGNINTVLATAGGAGWEKVQATAAGYIIARPASGASLDVHIETGGTLAALTVANWPIPSSGVDQLRIRNMSAVAQTFTATAGAGGFAGVVTADGNAATSGSYSIPVDMAVHVTIDPDGWVQVAPMGQEVSQAELNAVVSSLSDGSVDALFNRLRWDLATDITLVDLNNLATPGFYDGGAMPNSPTGSNGWYFIIQQNESNAFSGNRTQIAIGHGRQGSVLGRMFVRSRLDGVWSQWMQHATTADIPAYSATAPVVNGTAAVGTATTVSRGDHVHPTDTTRAAATALTDGSVNAYFDRLRWDGATAISSTNLNSLTVSGFYDGQTLTNAPNGATGWFYILHQRHSNLADVNWHHQTAYALGSGAGSTAGEIYARQNSSGTWSAWVRVDNGAVPALSSTTPAMDGTAAVGTGTTAARSDHVHPSDTAKASAAAPVKAYSASSTYAVGDQVIQANVLYKCKTAITVAEAFAVAKWDVVGSAVTVNNTLTSTSTTEALSAAQGKALQDTKEAVSNKGVANGYAGLGADGRVPAAQLPQSSQYVSYSDADVGGNAVVDNQDAVAQPVISATNTAVTGSVFTSAISETHRGTKWEIDSVMGAEDITNKTAYTVPVTAFTTVGDTSSIRAVYVDTNGNQSRRSAAAVATLPAVSIASTWANTSYPTASVAKTFDHANVTLALSDIKVDSFTSVTLGGANIGSGGSSAAGQYIANTLNTGVANEVTCWFGLYDGTYTKAIKAKFVVSSGNVDITIIQSVYWTGTVLSSASWTTAGAIPAGSTTSTIASAINSGAYGLHALTVNFKV